MSVFNSEFKLWGKYINCVRGVLHLGHVLAENYDLDIQQYSAFTKLAN